MPYHRHSRRFVGQREDIHQQGSDHAHCHAREHQMVDISTTKLLATSVQTISSASSLIWRMIPYHLKVTRKTNCWVHSPLSVSVISLSMTSSIPNHPNMLLPSTMYPTMRHSPISIRKFPCLWPRLHDMPGLSMEAEESSTRLYPTKRNQGIHQQYLFHR